MKKLILASTITLATTALHAGITEDLEKSKNHWLQEIGVYRNNTDEKQTFYTTYVKKEYCIEASYNYWGKYWSDYEFNSNYSIEVICRSKKNHYDFVRIKCDSSMNCN